jgi:Domain of unknown function (DUF1843)
MSSAVPPYGPPINDALKDPNTTLDTLVELRHRAASLLKAQGDLKGALKRLDREIQRRKSPSAKAK